jgi:heme/copper-type cytochrome/quinol oxidase subunit 4
MNILEEQNSQNKNKKRFDNFFLGFIVSIVLPPVMIVLISAGGELGSQSFYDHLMRVYHNYIFIKYAILALFPNMVIFFFLYKTERWKSAGGLIVATILFMILMVLKV